MPRENEQNNPKEENPAVTTLKQMWHSSLLLRLGLIVILLATLTGGVIFIFGLVTGNMLLITAGVLSMFFLGLWGTMYLAGREKPKAARRDQTRNAPPVENGWRYVLAFLGLFSFVYMLLVSAIMPEGKIEPFFFVMYFFSAILLFCMPLILHLLRKGRRGPRVIWWQVLLLVLGCPILMVGLMAAGSLMGLLPPGDTVPPPALPPLLLLLGMAIMAPFFCHQLKHPEEE